MKKIRSLIKDPNFGFGQSRIFGQMERNENRGGQDEVEGSFQQICFVLVWSTGIQTTSLSFSLLTCVV